MEPIYKKAQSIVGYSNTRSKYDFYTTPPYATEALLSVEKFEGNIWEPSCGNGAISKVLEFHNFSVISSDLIDRGYGIVNKDFLLENNIVDNIITNPPYSLAQKFVEHSLELAKYKIAFLLKLVFLEGERRKLMFQSTPLARIHVFSKRVTQLKDDLPQNNSGMMCFAWFVWDKAYFGKPTIDWI
jgi:hypothetical protein